MVPEVRNILNKASYLYSNFRDEYQRCYDRSSQVIIFGSYAYGCETNDSDIDIFFVGHEKRKVYRGLDFIWLHPRKLNSKTYG